MIAKELIPDDMIDPGSIRIVNSFEDMARWPATVALTRLELVPGRGLVVHADTDGWPDFRLDNDPAAGLVRSTLCVGFQIDGQWVMSGFLNYWAHGTHEGHVRTDSGAHPLEIAPDKGINNWQANWAYGGWGPLDTYVPKPGDLMAVMLAAGGTRMSKTRTVSERSQIVVVPLQLSGSWDFPLKNPKKDDPPPAPSVTLNHEQYDALMARFDTLDQELARARQELKEAGQELMTQLPSLLRRALVSR
jgi:hypothetical protein